MKSLTPQEEAIALVKQFRNILESPLIRGMRESEAKECAIICIDKVIEAFSQYKGMHDQEFINADVAYFQQVKIEINKI